MLKSKFKIVSVALLTAVVAILITVLPLHRSDKIWRTLDGAGADVWCDNELIRSPTTVLEKARCLMKIRTSSSIHVWITHVPADRVAFEDALRLLTPDYLTIDVAGTSDRQYLGKTFSGMKLEFPKTADYPALVSGGPESSLMATMDAFMRLEQLNPKQFHRSNRFESYIGTSPAGKCSTVFDCQNKTWIAIPSPK